MHGKQRKTLLLGVEVKCTKSFYPIGPFQTFCTFRTASQHLPHKIF